MSDLQTSGADSTLKNGGDNNDIWLLVVTGMTSNLKPLFVTGHVSSSQSFLATGV